MDRDMCTHDPHGLNKFFSILWVFLSKKPNVPLMCLFGFCNVLLYCRESSYAPVHQASYHHNCTLLIIFFYLSGRVNANSTGISQIQFNYWSIHFSEHPFEQIQTKNLGTAESYLTEQQVRQVENLSLFQVFPQDLGVKDQHYKNEKITTRIFCINPYLVILTLTFFTHK